MEHIIKQQLCQLAISSSLIIERQLNQLLDAYDLFTQENPPSTESDHFILADLQVSIDALSSVPHQIASWVSDIRNNKSPVISPEGFHEHVLTELMLHVNSLALFMSRKAIVSSFDLHLFAQAMQNLRHVNQRLSGA